MVCEWERLVCGREAIGESSMLRLILCQQNKQGRESGVERVTLKTMMFRLAYKAQRHKHNNDVLMWHIYAS